jgi:type I restriction enzyme S subunit
LNLLASDEIIPAICKWKPYTAYKKSGLEWVADIPSHWEMQRLKFALLQPLQYGANEEAGEADLASPRFVRITDINERGELRDDTFRSLAHEKAEPYLLEEGDLLLARSGATVGKSFQYRNAWGKCCFAGYLIRARLDQKKCLPDFLHYFTSSTNYWDWIASSLIQATIQNVSAEKYGNLSLPVPPPPEQQAIMSFLDRETAKIDTLVAKKERLIELLQEKRAALITRAVTEGLDPNVPMKDSDVEWLGKIPVHWNLWSVRNLIRKKLLQIQDGNHGELHPTAVDYVSEGIPFLMANDIRHQNINLTSCKFITKELADSLRIGFSQSSDVLLTHKGTIGETALVPRDLSTPYVMLTPQVTYYRSYSPKLIPRYLCYFFQSTAFKEQLTSLSVQQSTRDYVGITAQRELILSLPESWEQEQLVEYLDRETSKLDDLIVKVREGIKKLKEYRTALIAAAVTGKINVGEAKLT